MPSPDSRDSQLNLYFRSSAYDDDEYFSRWGDDVVQIWKRLHESFKPKDGKVGYLSWVEMCVVYEQSAALTNDPYFGLSMACHHHEDFVNAGPVVFILNHVTNIREFTEIVLRYLFLHTNGFRASMEEDIEAEEVTGIFDIHPLSGPHRQNLEHLLALICIMGFKFLEGFEVKRVTFQHRPPQDMQMYVKAFGSGANIEFNAPRNTIVSDIKYLNMDRSSFLTKAIGRSLKFYLDRQIKAHPYARKTIAGSVTEVLPSVMGMQGTGMDIVAKTLGLHPKKMRRLLKDEGQNYQDILENVRKHQAVRFLEDSDIKITHIARHLDYSSDRSFNTAFKRWFGMSPSDYRKNKPH